MPFTNRHLLEQEHLIDTLKHQNAHTNKQFSTALLILPLASIVPYLTTIFTPHTSFLSLLSITSLLSTAYLLYSLPPGITSISELDALNRPKPLRGSRGAPSFVYAGKGPIQQYLPYLNIGLCVVLGLLGWLVGRRDEGLWVGFGWLPGGVYGMVLLAKYVMGSVNPEEELGALRYGFKGA